MRSKSLKLFAPKIANYFPLTPNSISSALHARLENKVFGDGNFHLKMGTAMSGSSIISRKITILAISESAVLRKMSIMQKSGALIYRPDLACDDEALKRALLKENPDVVIIGSHKFNRDILKTWRQANHQDSKLKPLLLLRAGTGKKEIDENCARELGIRVKNTPVNAIHVAKYMARQILDSEQRNLNDKFETPILGLIGFGGINSALAWEALKKGYKIIAWSPSLTASFKNNVTNFRAIDLAKLQVANSRREVFEKSDKISIAVSLDGLKAVGLIDQDEVAAIKNGARIYCVSEPEIFTPKAQKKLVEKANQSNIKIDFDNSPKLMREFQENLVDWGYLGKNITLSSKVMSDRACKRDIGNALLAEIFGFNIEYELPEIFKQIRAIELQHSQQKQINIVGAGISGIITALYFQAQGFKVNIFDQSPNPDSMPDNLGLKKFGITASGVDGRHLSWSETVPNACKNREELWRGNLVARKLRQNDANQSGNKYEEGFLEKFATLANNPALLAIMKEAVALFNSISINNEEFGWKYLQANYQEIAQNIFGSGKMLRIFLSDEDLAEGLKFQTSIHNPGEVRMIKAAELKILNPDLYGNLVDSKKIAGAVEVPAQAVKVLSLWKELVQYLEKSGVKIKWNHEVEAKNGFVIKDEANPSKDVKIDSDEIVVIASGIKALLPKQKEINKVCGIFYTLPDMEGIEEPFKIQAAIPLMVMNIIPGVLDGKKVIYISGGGEYLGHGKVTKEELKPLIKMMEEVICEFFPRSWQELSHSNRDKNINICDRPMTATGFPQIIFSPYSKEETPYIAIGGTNAGGTVMAPYLAQTAVAKAMIDCGEIADQKLEIRAKKSLEILELALHSIGDDVEFPPRSIQPTNSSQLLPTPNKYETQITPT
jgi:hypothetical protein